MTLPIAVAVRYAERMKPTGILIERRGDWLFHTTDTAATTKILRYGVLDGEPYVSFSDTLTWGGGVTLVFSKSRMKRRVMKVEYTTAWARKHPDHAAYISGDLWGYEEAGKDVDAIMGEFVRMKSEREWVSKRESVYLRPGDIDRIIVKPGPGSERSAHKILKRAAAESPLLDPEDVMWRDLGQQSRWWEHKPQRDIPGGYQFSPFKLGAEQPAG